MLRKFLILGVFAGASASIPIVYQSNPRILENLLKSTATSKPAVEAQPDGRFVSHGTLSLHGMSMAQDVEFRLSGSGAQRHVEGTATIDRVGFGIGMGSHGNDLEKTVAIDFAFDAKRA